MALKRCVRLKGPAVDGAQRVAGRNERVRRARDLTDGILGGLVVVARVY